MEDSLPNDIGQLTKTPLSTFVIDEEDTSAFDIPQIQNATKFRERPRHASQTDFTSFFNKRDEEKKEEDFDSQITFILNSFAKQYMREYIKMKIKTSVYDTIDQELNRKSFTSVPQYYHLRKDIHNPNHSSNKLTKHPNPNDLHDMSQEMRETEGFQPVYSLRIASSRTEIGADKNEYTAYVIVGSRISPFDSKITVCVKRFTELRTFASEIVRRLHKIGKALQLPLTVSEFPYHTRLFGTIDKKALERRRNKINAYLESVCADENAVRHSYFLSFFDFNDGQYSDTHNVNEDKNRYFEDEFRLKCIEETLEIIGMNGGIPIDSDVSDDDDQENEDNFEFIKNPKSNQDQTMELNFEVPYDLHHYKDPEYKLVAAIFDIIQQQLETRESELKMSEEFSESEHKPMHVSTNSNFLNSYLASMNSHGFNINELDIIPSDTGMAVSHHKPKHRRKESGGAIAPSPLKHIRAMSIIEYSVAPASPMQFHPSISTKTGKIMSAIANDETDSATELLEEQNSKMWTAQMFKNKFNSSIRGIEGGPRIIRTASEATSDRSLSYKIPTMVSQVWNKISILLDKKRDKIPVLLQAVNKDLYPIIQEAMNDVAPIIKLLYNNTTNINAVPMSEANVNLSIHTHNTTVPEKSEQKHGKYLSMFGHGYDGDEDSSSDSDGSEIRRSIGIRHFPYVNAMKQYCLTESRLYEFFLAFENLAIDQIFGDTNIIFGNSKKKSEKNTKKNNSKKSAKHRYKSSVDFGDYISANPSNENEQNGGPKYEFMHLLHYNYAILENTSSLDFTDRIKHIERIHSQINLILCEIMYSILKCFMKCLGDIILYKDALEESYLQCGHTFDQDVIGRHEDSLLNILRDSGYNISFIVDDLKQKIKSEFKDYSSVIFNPLLEGISTIGELSLNCICLMISQFVFDDGEFPQNITQFRQAFIDIWFEPIDYYIADFTECVFYILYQSSIGLVHSASQDLLQNNIFNYASSSTSHSTSTWYQILRGQNLQNIKKFIPKILSKNVSVKDILDLVIERTLTNIVDETLIYIKLECEKAFFLKFQKKEQRLFNQDF